MIRMNHLHKRSMFIVAGALISIAIAHSQSSGPAARQVERMRAGWGINNLTDDVLKLAAQMGVRDIVLYGGPGNNNFPGTTRPLTKARAGYADYLAARHRIESFGLRLAAVEGGFVHLPKYHDVVFGGSERDRLIEELIAEIRDMARAGVPAYG